MLCALLQRPHLGIAATLGQQVCVCAALDDLATVHDQNLMGIDHGRQAVCNHQCGLALSGAGQFLLNGTLGLAVQR